VRSQQAEIRRELGRHVDRGEVPPVTGRLSDDVGVAGKNLARVRAIRDDIRARVERLAATLRPAPEGAGR
jgi:hypothetical protein